MTTLLPSAISRRAFATGALATAVAATLAACGSDSDGQPKGIKKDGDTVVISIGATPQPHVTMLTHIKDNLLSGTGIKLDIKEINDYTTPNISLKDGSIAANFFQTPNYLKQQIEEHGYDFVAIADVHVEPMGIYSKKATTLEEIPDGGQIVLNNDPANTARGLKLLEAAKLITLDPAAALPTDSDVTSNPHNFTFTTVDGAQVANTMQDAAAVVLNGNYALDAGLKPAVDALRLESVEAAPANQLVVRSEDKDNDSLKKLAEIMNSADFKSYIESTWADGSVLPAF
ncbi:MetQ/NlpA family ABC transporter substrate-binding protein [Actinomyces marmotae]|uniref:MetQ/NlpA family ABC transporter substrate-binding protein n=1 Tax=Actinomyces marmotae TaxID=2737173 RepID=UPI001F2AEC17|nr:MetQ/NlpA family ABC transporter substrate-binding protein [Actinomyces marmotae]